MQREEHNLYFLDVRVFELAEVKLLVDAVQSSRFIPTKKSKSLIEKLSTFVGPHQSNILKRQLYVDKRVKANNEGIFYLVDNIHTAIREKKRITFQYQEYNQNKEKVLKHQCYNQLNNGNKKKRVELGLDTEGYCDSRMIADWKLDFMAKSLLEHLWTDRKESVLLALDLIKRQYEVTSQL